VKRMLNKTETNARLHLLLNICGAKFTGGSFRAYILNNLNKDLVQNALQTADIQLQDMS
jgi:hypothetical protein